MRNYCGLLYLLNLWPSLRVSSLIPWFSQVILIPQISCHYFLLLLFILHVIIPCSGSWSLLPCWQGDLLEALEHSKVEYPSCHHHDFSGIRTHDSLRSNCVLQPLSFGCSLSHTTFDHGNSHPELSHWRVDCEAVNNICSKIYADQLCINPTNKRWVTN